MTVATASVALNVYISQSGQDVNLGNITASAVTASVLKASEGIFQGSDQNIVNKIVHMGKSSTQVGGSDTSTGIVPFNQTAKTLITQSVSFPGSRDNVFDGKYIWNGPFDNGIFSKIDPSTLGTCFDGENIWAGPYTAGNNFFLKFNVSSSTISQVGTTVAVTAACLYGQVYDGKYVWAMPYISGQLYRIDPTTDTVASSSLAGSAQWGHAVFDGKNVWGISYNSPNLLKITDPENFTYELIPHGQGTAAFFGACFDGTHIWISPNNADNILKVNVETNEITTIAHGLGNGILSRCVFDGNSVWMTTLNTANILKINPQTNEITTIPRPWSHNNSLGLLFDGEKIWSATFQTNDYTTFYPPEYGEPNLFTSGDMRVGRDLIVNGSSKLHTDTNFGSGLDHSHRITGSVYVTSSLTVNGVTAITGSVEVSGSVVVDGNVSASLVKSSDGFYQGSDQNIVTKILHQGKTQASTDIGQVGSPVVFIQSQSLENTTFVNAATGTPRNGLFDGEFIWTGPLFDTNLRKYNPHNGELIMSIPVGGGKHGLTDSGELIWSLPFTVAGLNGYDKETGALVKSYTQINGVIQAVFTGKYIITPNWSNNTIYRADLTTDIVSSASAAATGTNRFTGASFDGKNAWFSAYDSPDFVKLDVETLSQSLIPHGQGSSQNYIGSTFDGSHVWFAPNDAANIAKINIETDELTLIPHGKGLNMSTDVVFDGNSLWFIADGAGQTMVKLDPQTHEMVDVDVPYSMTSPAFGVFDGEKIWVGSNADENWNTFYPKEFGRPNLFTSGDLKIGGESKFAGVSKFTDTVEVTASLNVTGSITLNGNNITPQKLEYYHITASTETFDLVYEPDNFTAVKLSVFGIGPQINSQSLEGVGGDISGVSLVPDFRLTSTQTVEISSSGLSGDLYGTDNLIQIEYPLKS
jgi:streptogramin lyase